MRKKRIVLAGLAAALLLSACGKKYSPAPVTVTTAPAAEAEKNEASESGSAGEAEQEGTAGQTENGEASAENVSGKISEETIRISDNSYSDTDWDEIAQQTIFHIACSRLQVLNDGYDNLNQALGDYWDGIWEELKASHDANYDDAAEIAGQYPPGEAPYYELTHTGQAIRGDRNVFSFLDVDYSYLGGAHPYTAVHGVNFDTASGKQLSLQDVTADYDGFCQYVKTCLEEMSREEDGPMLFEWYEEDLQKFFSGEYHLEWVMEQDGITVYFNPYDLASYADGALEVTVRFAEHPELFKEDYIPSGAGVIKMGSLDLPVKADVNGDGTPEEISVFYRQDGVEFSGPLEVTVGDKKVSHPEYGSLSGWWVLCDGAGGAWCYVQMLGDNGWPSIQVFDLSGENPSYAGEMLNMSMQAPASDPSHFCMATHIDFLGSYYGYQDYHIGKDGMPETDSSGYRIYEYGGMENRLTATKELPATACKDETDLTGEEIVLPAGTNLYPRSTDGTSWILMEREDGSLCRIYAEGEPYALTIDGVSEYDCFENLSYAG